MISKLSYLDMPNCTTYLVLESFKSPLVRLYPWDLASVLDVARWVSVLSLEIQASGSVLVHMQS